MAESEVSTCASDYTSSVIDSANLNHTPLNSLDSDLKATCVEQGFKESTFSFLQHSSFPDSIKEDLSQSSLKKELGNTAISHKEQNNTQTTDEEEKVLQTPQTEDQISPEKDVKTPAGQKIINAASDSKLEDKKDCSIIRRDSDESKTTPDISLLLGQISACLQEQESCSLLERVGKIQEALTLTTKYSHCNSCLMDKKKSQAPDTLCLVCLRSFCHRCADRHKNLPFNSNHIMVPVVPRRRSSSEPSHHHLLDPMCPKHTGVQLQMYCKNCEMLVCKNCIIDLHANCPGVVATQQYANEEREVTKRCRVKYAQVMRFFSEQRRDTEETLAALSMKKRDIEAVIRKFFSTLMKACMDVEAALLEEIETSVCDHTDLLREQSSAWLNLQECTQQLLDITDMLHFLPTSDFLPLSVASQASLNQALRNGENLAASAPPQMTLTLGIEPALQRDIVRRIKEVRNSALNISIHNTLTLRKVTSMSFCAPNDKEEPLVTGMVLLTQTILVATDFNNTCLKLLHRDEGGDSWTVSSVLLLKWRPFGITKLSEKYHLTYPPEDGLLEKQSEAIRESGQSCAKQFSKGASLERQSAVALDDDELILSHDAVSMEVQVAVSSPFAGCFIVTVPISGNKKMRVLQNICEDKGIWGIAHLEKHTLAISALDCGRSYISLIDIDKNIKRRLPLSSSTTITPLVSPRLVIATSPSSILVVDQSKKAAIHVSTDGKILFTYTGPGNQKLSHPEGLCMDGQDRIFISDSGDHSVSIITKAGLTYSKTGSQQNDILRPQAVCVDRNSCLYVANEGGKLLTVYDII